MNAEQFRKWRAAGRELLGAAGTPTTINKEQRTVDVCWFTGVDVPRVDLWTGEQYMLHFDPSGADLSRLNAGAAVLDCHSTDDGAAGQKGRVERAWMAGGRYFATLRFSRRSEVSGLWTDIQDGIVSKFSMGVELLDVVEQRDRSGTLTMKTAAKWRPFEISVEPLPADFGTCVLSAQASALSVGFEAAYRQRVAEILRLRDPAFSVQIEAAYRQRELEIQRLRHDL